MTPESIIQNVLEQLDKLKMPSAIIMVNGARADIFAKSMTTTLPLFSIPTSIFFSACNRIFESNTFPETQHFKFSPNMGLRMVRMSSDLIYKSSRGKDLIMTTSVTGTSKYQVLWFLNLSHEALKNYEDSEVNFEDVGNVMSRESGVVLDDDEINADVVFSDVVSEATKAQSQYDAFIHAHNYYIREYDGESSYPVLSRGPSFFSPYITVGSYILEG